MKILSLTLCLVLGGIVTVFAQNPKPKKTIIVDFNNPVLPEVQTIKAKQSLVLKIININPYLYDVSFNDTLIVYPNQKPDSFDALFKMPALTDVPKTAASTGNPPAKTAASPKWSEKVTKAKAEEKKQDQAITDYLKDYNGSELAVKALLKIGSVSTELDKLIDNCYLDSTELKDKSDAYIMSFFGDLDPNSIPVGIVPSLDTKFDQAQAGLTTNIATGEQLKKKYQAILTSANNTMRLSEYRTIETTVNDKIALIDKALDNGKKLNDKLKEFKDAKVGEKITESYTKVMTSRITKSISTYANYGTDELTIKVTVKKKKDVVCKNEITNFKVNAIVLGGVKIDFSTGAAFNFGNKKFFDQTYRADPYLKPGNVATDSITIVRNRNNNVLIPSLGVFLNAYTRVFNNLNVGGIFGASVGSDQRLYTHLGVSVIMGKSDRFIISGGLSEAKANVLDGKYNEGQLIKKADAPQIIPTVTAIRLGAFLSVTWNLKLIP